MLLCAHQQEGQHLSTLTGGLSVHGNQAEPVSDHHRSFGLTKWSWYLEEVDSSKILLSGREYIK